MKFFLLKYLILSILKKKKKKTKANNRLEILILCNYYEIVKKTGNFDDFTETIYTEI